MKRLNLEATDENVLNSIKENTLNRNIDVRDFVEAIERMEGNLFVSLDARWGDGKTFFVRQTEKTLEYLTKKKWADENDKELQEMRLYFEKTELNKIDLQQSYLPIYYNAWLYDNHNDPLMSLLFMVIKKTKQYIDTNLEKSKKEALLSALSSLSVSFNYHDFQFSVSSSGLKEALTLDDVLKDIKTAEEIRGIVKAVLDSVINEKAQRLVIFLDELDRCRPSYAVEMLERIKHFIDDERIIVVVSLNKEQLVHTIKNVYGNGFDASSYLNRFFDIPFQLPACNMSAYISKMNLDKYSTYMLSGVAREIRANYDLTMRDTVIYMNKIQAIEENSGNYGSDTWAFLSILIPVICLLDITNVEEKRKVLNGEGEEIIKKIVLGSTAGKKVIIHFVKEYQVDEDTVFRGWEEFVKIYKFIFSNTGHYPGYYPGKAEIHHNTKYNCLKLCNEV